MHAFIYWAYIMCVEVPSNLWSIPAVKTGRGAPAAIRLDFHFKTVRGAVTLW